MPLPACLPACLPLSLPCCDQNINMAHKKYSKQLANTKKEERKKKNCARKSFLLLLTTAGNKCRAQNTQKAAANGKNGENTKKSRAGECERAREKAKLLICLCAVGYFCSLSLQSPSRSLSLSLLLCLPTFFFIHFDCLTPSSVKLSPLHPPCPPENKIKYLSQAQAATHGAYA